MHLHNIMTVMYNIVALNIIIVYYSAKVTLAAVLFILVEGIDINSLIALQDYVALGGLPLMPGVYY